MAQYVFTMNRVGKIVPPKRQILKDISLSFFPGAKIGVLGLNGAGKSTLLKIMAGVDKDIEGEAIPMPGINIGYLPQEPALDPAKTVRETVEEGMGEVMQAQEKLNAVYDAYADPDADFDALAAEQARLEAIIAAAGTNVETQMEIAADALRLPPWDAVIGNLSGGEKRRVALCRLLLSRPDMLLLDEPTNHLDMRSKDVLKDALKEFDGTVIVVSHDREFLDGLVDKVYEFGNKRVIEHLGGIYDFLEHKKMDSLCELERSTQTTTSMEGNASEPTRNKLSYEARKEQSKAIKKVEKAIAESEKKITELENSIAAIEAKLATPEGAADVSLYTEYSELKKKLSDTMDLWTEQTLELEELNAANS